MSRTENEPVLAASLIGTEVGHFRIDGLLAEGGMGEVYAGFDENLMRKVALKVIRGTDRLDEQAKARFLREARILSQLEHPGICRIYDYVEGGSFDVLVLEHIEGRVLAEAMEEDLPWAEKLRLAEEIAQALVAAHARRVVHRDLKPSNIMLTVDGSVKVLDFGVAKRLYGSGSPTLRRRSPPPSHRDGPVDEAPLDDADATVAGEMVGTVTYMSPEQARGERASPASDMYSYGLLLQHLFTGARPYRGDLSHEELVERARRAETLPLTGLHPDLEALINRLKSLAAARRPSAIDTVEHLRWIRDKPRRQRRRALLVAAISAAVLFALTMSVQAVRLSWERDRASHEAEIAREVSDFLVSLFEVSEPNAAQGNTIRAREILDNGASRVLSAREDDPPLTRARMLETIGKSYRSLGLYAEAAPSLEEALAIRQRVLGEDHPLVASSHHEIALLHHDEGRLELAESAFGRALEIRRQGLGRTHPAVADTLYGLARVHLDARRPAEARRLAEGAVRILEEADGDPTLRLGRCFVLLALAADREGRPAEMERLFDRSVALLESGDEARHPELVRVLLRRAERRRSHGRPRDAETDIRRALQIGNRTLEPDHPDLGAALSLLSWVHHDLGLVARAEIEERQALAIRASWLGEQHPEVAESLHHLARLHREAGRLEEAREEEERALRIRRRELGAHHASVARSLHHLALIHLALQEEEEAEPLFREALEIQERVLDPDHPERLATARDYEALLERQSGT